MTTVLRVSVHSGGKPGNTHGWVQSQVNASQSPRSEQVLLSAIILDGQT